MGCSCTSSCSLDSPNPKNSNTHTLKLSFSFSLALFLCLSFSLSLSHHSTEVEEHYYLEGTCPGRTCLLGAFLGSAEGLSRGVACGSGNRAQGSRTSQSATMAPVMPSTTCSGLLWFFSHLLRFFLHLRYQPPEPLELCPALPLARAHCLLLVGCGLAWPPPEIHFPKRSTANAIQ